MCDMNKQRRTSATQNDVLYVLHLFERKGNSNPIAATALFNMINECRSFQNKLHPNNFRVSCHTLVERDLLNKYRSASLKLAFKLSESGKTEAQQIYQRRIDNE